MTYKEIPRTYSEVGGRVRACGRVEGEEESILPQHVLGGTEVGGEILGADVTDFEDRHP